MKRRTSMPALWMALGALGIMAPQLLRATGGALPVLSSSPRGRIAFVVPREGMGQEIAIMNADGSARTTISRHPGVDVQPAWSPDGRRLAFSSFREGAWGLYVMAADGSGQIRIAEGGLEPAWSPDGGRIAFCRQVDAGRAEHALFVVHPDGTGLLELTRQHGYDGHPTWSPDGKAIAFHSSKSGSNDIYVMNADGSGVRQVTWLPSSETSPAWSPDGKRIAFESDRNAVPNDPKLDRNVDVYTIGLDGEAEARVTMGPGADVFPAWSPDGKRILAGYSEGKTALLYVMDADGGNRACLSNPKRPWDYSPSSWTAR